MRVFAILSSLVLGAGCAVLNATPVSVSISGTSDITNLSTLSVAANGTGTVSPWGSTSLTINGTFDKATKTADGSFVLDFGSGNTLDGTFTTPAILLVPGGSSASGTGTADVTSGTGLYAGYTGSFDLNGSSTATGLMSATFSLTGTGNVSAPSAASTTPEPASLLLIPAGLLALALLRTRA